MTAIHHDNQIEYSALQMTERILLGPGPSMVHPRVLQAMTNSVVGHLDPYFIEVMDKTQELLRYVFQTKNQLTLPVSGTGSAAMETAVANFVQPGTRVLVLVKGYFGLRIAEMVRRYGGDLKVLERPWGEIINPEEVRQELDSRPAEIVAVVHGETSTGVKQPLDEIVAAVHDQGGLVIVDTVASLGGVPLSVDEVGIDICYSGSQKCLSVPPGLGPITIGPRAVDWLASRSTPVANWYLDLTMLKQYWGAERIYHHTAPISAIFGLYEGLRMVHEQGLEHLWAKHQANARLLWDGLEAMGLELFVPEGQRLVSLTTVKVPDGVNEAEVRARLLREYNIEIAGGLGELKGKIWRIGLMGHSSRTEHVLLLLHALSQILAR
jgi:alanine-glyoxylate transaminase / serine-glyoxylate transaminase / serine-pyruvate transaminase